MKKISSLLKGAAVTAMLLTTGSAFAAPSFEDILGDYTFTADVTYADGISDEVKASLPSTFTISLSEVNAAYSDRVNLNGFLEWNSSIQLSYTDGSLSPRNFAYLSTETATYALFLSDPSGSIGYGECYDFSWTVNDDGTITIPDFIVRKAGFTAYPYPIEDVATFRNIVCKNPNATVDPEPDPDPTPGGELPTSVLGTYKYTGTVTYGPEATEDIQAQLPATFQFVINENTSNAFNIRPQLSEFLCYENEIITYDSETGIITPNNPLSGNLKDIEYIIKFGNENGEYEIQDGRYWEDYIPEWTVNADGSIDIPTFTVVRYGGTVYATYSGGKATPVKEMPQTVTGQYTFKGNVQYTAKATENIQNLLPADFDFIIDMSDEFNSKPQINQFLFFLDAVKCTYNAETGALTSNYGQFFQEFVEAFDIMVGLGNATGGDYCDDYAIAWTVDYDGNITIPDFTVVDKAGNIYAYYTGCTATLVGGGNQGEDDGKPHDFAGTHNTTNWWIADYSIYNDNVHYTVSSGHDIIISINDNNQYTSIAGLTVDPNMIEFGYNQGTVKGNVWSVDLNNFGNVVTRESDENPSGFVLSGPTVPKDLTPDTESVLTLTYNSSDDTYTLSDFTMWYKTVEGSDDNTTTSWKILFRYSTSEILPYTPEDDEPKAIEGNWTFTLFDRYQGSESLGKVDVAYEASVSGNTVTFEDPTETYPMIVAELTSDDTLTFKYAKATNVGGTYTLYQQPFINSDGTVEIDELTEEEFIAVFNAETGTLTFPANSGLRYGYFGADGNLSYWSDAFDLIEAVNTDVNTTPRITLSGVDYPTEVDNGEFYVNFRYTTTNVPAGSTLTAYLKDAAGNINEELVLAGSPVYWNIQGIDKGVYDFTLYIQATDAAGNVIATSNSESFQTDIIVGIDTIGADTEAARYFNLQGVEVKSPANGVFIRIQNGKAVKVLR